MVKKYSVPKAGTSPYVYGVSDYTNLDATQTASAITAIKAALTYYGLMATA